MNRNPFIDHPSLADYIWGPNVGQPWSSSLSTKVFNDLNVAIFPSPAKDYLMISGLKSEGTIEIYSVSGSLLFRNSILNETILNLNLTSGMYLAKITSENKSVLKKIVIE